MLSPAPSSRRPLTAFVSAFALALLLAAFAPEAAAQDADGDGIPDTEETGDPDAPVDTDGDGRPDFQDIDADGDGIPDAVESGPVPSMPFDSDDDGQADFRDLDTDGDGLPDRIEAAPDTHIEPAGQDSDGDGLDDAFDTYDADTPPAEGSNATGSRYADPFDTDRDGTADFRDTGSDTDSDGIPNEVEIGGDPSAPRDSDGDGVPDYQDIDSDGDLIPDLTEAESDASAPRDSDGDGTPDHLDLDSDDDGISDYVEADPDENIRLAGIDTDRDGLDEGFAENPIDTYNADDAGDPGNSAPFNASGSAYAEPAPAQLQQNDLRAGWRMYAPPFEGLTVRDLAQQNLVQSIDGGAYADAPVAPNLYDGYDGGYAPQNTETDGCRVDESIEQDDFQDDANAAWDCPTDVDAPLQSGEGFLWYIFDQQIAAETVPVGTFAWAPTGTAPTGNVVVNADEDVLEPNEEFHFLGNPFDAHFDLAALNIGPDGLDADGDGLPDFCSVVQVWDPNAGTSGEYVPIVQGDTNGFTGGRVARLQGFFVERNDFDMAGSAPSTVLTFDRSGITTEETPFVGATSRPAAPAVASTSALRRSNQEAAPRVIVLRLDSEDAALAGGQARLRLTPGATLGSDAFEAKALVPLAPRYAVPAFLRSSDAARQASGAPALKSVASLPHDLGAPGVQEMDLAIVARGQARDASAPLTLRWPRIENVPDEWILQLVDRATGTTVDLHAEQRYPFTLADGTSSHGQSASLLQLGEDDRAGSLPEMGVQSSAPLQTGASTEATAAVSASASHARVAAAAHRFGASLASAHFAAQTASTSGPRPARFALRVGPPAQERSTPSAPALEEPYLLTAPYPNPASGRVALQYAAREAGEPLRIELYNVLGQLVRVLHEGPVARAGEHHRLTFSTSAVPSGIYVVRLSGEAGQRTRTFTVVR